ncbi:MAG: isochorismatase family cysteine hydrolase [Candidatus Promineifilaceae bacterium]|nr:isochorismatase family cysteine hydrolase [Candidatus Promineifilaceae bacterium]
MDEQLTAPVGDVRDDTTPSHAGVALLLIDVINDMEFEGGERLLAQAAGVVDALADLKRRAKAAGIPVIYVNDNFGRWQSDFKKQVAHVLEDGVRGASVAERLLPDEDDYFVLKPRHSGFYSTTLDTLLAYLGVDTLILAGFAADICVLFTASDAYIRDFRIIIPADCVASNEAEFTEQALALMARVLGADVRPAFQLPLERLAQS